MLIQEKTAVGTAANRIIGELHKDNILPAYWMDYNTGLFPCVQNNNGVLVSYKYSFFTAFAVPHNWFYKDDNTDQWINGNSNDLDTILSLRTLNINSEDYAAKKLQAKLTIQCIMPSASCDYKKKGSENILTYNPFLQLDFDNLHEYDIEEVRQAIIDLPFVCLVQKSVSGFGLWALVMIEEPGKLAAYAEHCFTLFEKYKIPIDTGKGMNPTQLRFLSWDQNIVWRDDPKPLKVKRFNTRKVEVKKSKPVVFNTDSSALIKWALKEITAAQIGQRFETVRKIAYTLGGHNTGLDEIKQAIEFSSQYQGVTKKYLRHADEAFQAGQKNPIAA
jgi:hypothetical protein